MKIRETVVPQAPDYGQGARDAAHDDLRRQLQANPLTALGAKLLTNNVVGYTFTAAETKNIRHGLGRAFTAWWPVLLPVSTSYIAPRSLAATTEFPKDLYIRCQMQSACTVYFMVI